MRGGMLPPEFEMETERISAIQFIAWELRSATRKCSARLIRHPFKVAKRDIAQICGSVAIMGLEAVSGLERTWGVF